MKKNVGMTIAQKGNKSRDEGWKWDQSLFCISSQQSLHICWVASDNSAYYVGIVGWIYYRTKIDPTILHPYPCFLAFLSNGDIPTFFSFHGNVFSLSYLFLVFFLFFPHSFMYRVRSFFYVYAGTDERRIVLQ